MSRTHRTPPTRKTTTTSRSRLSDTSDGQEGMSETGLTYEGLARTHGAGTGVPQDQGDAPLTGEELEQTCSVGIGIPQDQGNASLTDGGLERTRGAGAGKQQAHSTETIASLWARDEGGRMMRVDQAREERQTQGDAQTSAEMLQSIGANTSQRTGATGVNQGRQEQQTQGNAQTSAEMLQGIGANTSQRARFAGVNLAQEEQVERITVKVFKVLAARQEKIDKRRDSELTKCRARMEQMMARIEGARRQDERPERCDSDDGHYQVGPPGHPNDNQASSSAGAQGGVTQVDRLPRLDTDEELDADGYVERGGFGFGDVERGGFGFEDLEREGVGNADRRNVVGSVEPQVDQGRRVVRRQPSGQDRAEEVQRGQSRRVLNGQPYGQDGMSSLNPDAPPFDIQYRRQHPPVDIRCRQQDPQLDRRGRQREDPQFDTQRRREDPQFDVRGRRRDPQFDNQGRRQEPPYDIQDRRQDPREMEREQDAFVGPETSQESDRSIQERWNPREWEEERGAGSYAPRRDTEPKFKNVLARLQDFYGSKRDTVKWERWVERFDLHCEVANIGHAHYVKLLGEHLQGSAYEIYRGILRLEPSIRWTELEGKLKAHFQPEKNSALQVAEYNCARQEKIDKRRDSELTKCRARMEQMMARIEGARRQDERPERRDSDDGQYQVGPPGHPNDNQASSSAGAQGGVTQVDRLPRPDTDEELDADGYVERGGFGFGDVERGGFGFENLEREGVGNADRRNVVGSVEPQVDQGRRVVRRQPSGQDRAEEVQRGQSRRVLNGQPYGQDGMSSLNPNAPPFDIQDRQQDPQLDRRGRQREDPQFDIQGRRQDLQYDVQGRRRDPQFDNQGRRQEPPYDIQDRRQDPPEIEREQDAFVGPETSQESDRSIQERWAPREWEEERGAGSYAPRRDTEPKFKNVLAKLQDFYGSKRDAEKWESWVERFDLHCEVANIGHAHYVKLLGEHLQGSAYEIYRGILRLEPRIRWTELQGKLKGHFQPEKNSALQVAEYNCAAWEHEDGESLNEFVTRLQGYMHEGIPDATVETKEMLIRVKFWESLPLRWKTQIETSSPRASLSEVVKLAIEIQVKEKADKGIHRITDALKRTFRERKGGQDFVPRGGGQGRFGAPGNRNFPLRGRPNFDKIQTGQVWDRTGYGNEGGPAQRSSGFNNFGRRPYNDNYARRPFNNSYGQRTIATPQRTDQRREFTPRPRFQGGNGQGRANFGAVPPGRSGGQRNGPVVKRLAYRAPARGATQAAAYHHPTNYAVEYGRNTLEAPGRGCGAKQWEWYLKSTVNVVAAGKAGAPGRERQAMKCPVWTLDVKVGSELANALFDTGSTISIISLEQFMKYADEIGPMEAARRVKKVTGTHRALSGHPLPFLGMIEVVITVGTDIGVVPCYILKETPTALLLGDSFAEVFGVRCTVGSTSCQEWCVGPRGRNVKGAAGFRRSMGEGMMTVCHVARDTKVMAGCRSTVTCRAPAELMGKECMVQREIDKVLEEMFFPDSLVMMDRKGEFKVVVDNFCPKTQLLRKRQDLGIIGRIVAHGNAKDGQTVGLVSQHCVLPEGQWSIPVQRRYPSGRAESMDEVKIGHELNDMETQRVTAPLDVFALEYGELATGKDVRHDTPTTAEAQEVRQKLRLIPHGMVKQLKTGTEETVWRREEVWRIRNAAKEVTAVRKAGLMVDQATPPTPQAKESHKAGNIEEKAKGSQMSEDKSVEVDQNVTWVDVKVPETSYGWDRRTGWRGGPSGREDARAWQGGLKENHRGVSRSWRGILEEQKYPGGDEANGGFRRVVRGETSPGVRTDSGITSRKVRSEREMFDGSNVKAALGDGAIHIAEVLPAEHERLTQIVARMTNGPHVTDGRMVQTGRWSDAEQRVADLPDRASLPSRTTFTVKMKYHNDEGKNRDTSQTAMWASRRSTMKDGYGVEKACDLTKIHEASTGRADDRASELVELMKDPKVDWTMVDISEGYGVPRRGRVECYQLLVDTRKRVKRTKWKNYRKAIEALAPRKWRDRWKKKSTIRVKESRGMMVREGTRDDHIWRVVWVREDQEVVCGMMPNPSTRFGPVEMMMNREMVLKQGDLVYLRNPSLKSGPEYKLKFEWEGPYEITSRDGANVYIRMYGKPGVDTKCGHLCKVSKLKLLTRPVEKGDEQVTEAPPEVRTLRAWKRQARSRDGQNDDQTAQASSLKTMTRPTQDAAAKRPVGQPRKGTPLREAECPGVEVVVRRPVDRPRKVVQPRNVGCMEMEKRIGKNGDRSERRGGEDHPARGDWFERRGGEDRPARGSRLECRGGEDRPANGSWLEGRGGEDRPAERDGFEGRGGEDRPVRDTSQGTSKNKRADKINKEKDAFKALVVLGRESNPSDMWSPHKAKTGYGEREWLKLAGGEGRGSERLKYERTVDAMTGTTNHRHNYDISSVLQPKQRNAEMDDQTPLDADEDEGEQVPRHLDAPTNDERDEVDVVTVKEEEASSEVTGGGVQSEVGEQPRTLHAPVRGPRGPHREEEPVSETDELVENEETGLEPLRDHPERVQRQLNPGDILPKGSYVQERIGRVRVGLRIPRDIPNVTEVSETGEHLVPEVDWNPHTSRTWCYKEKRKLQHQMEGFVQVWIREQYAAKNEEQFSQMALKCEEIVDDSREGGNVADKWHHRFVEGNEVPTEEERRSYEEWCAVADTPEQEARRSAEREGYRIHVMDRVRQGGEMNTLYRRHDKADAPWMRRPSNWRKREADFKQHYSMEAAREKQLMEAATAWVKYMEFRRYEKWRAAYHARRRRELELERKRKCQMEEEREWQLRATEVMETREMETVPAMEEDEPRRTFMTTGMQTDKETGDDVTEGQLLPKSSQETDEEMDDDVTEGQLLPNSSRVTETSERTEAWGSNEDTLKCVGAVRAQKLGYAATLPIPEKMDGTEQQKRWYSDKETIRPQRGQKITASSTPEIDEQDHMVFYNNDALTLHIRHPLSGNEQIALIYARTFTLPHVAENCVLIKNELESAYASSWHMKENAPMPMRSTHTIHIIAHVNQQKRPYRKWHRKEKKALGYKPFDETAYAFPVLISLIDCHGTGAIYNLRRIYSDDDDGGQIAAPPEMMSLLKDRSYRWVIADDRAEEDLPVGGMTVFYQQLLRNWAGDGLCPVMVSTLEMLRNVDYQSYQDAIWALVPPPWVERWTQIADGMAERRSVAGKGPKQMVEQLCVNGTKELKDALVAEAAMDNYMWRIAWLGGEVEPEIVMKEWKAIVKVWQDELGLLLRTRQGAWQTEWYDTDTEMAQAYDDAVRDIKKIAVERAEDLQRKRLERKMEAREPVGIWDERTVEEQATAFQQLAKTWRLFEDITPVMYRQLKARLFFQTRYEYDAPIRDAVRKYEGRKKRKGRRRREMDTGQGMLAVGALKQSARELEEVTEQWEERKRKRRMSETERMEEGGQSGAESSTENWYTAEESEPFRKRRKEHTVVEATLELPQPHRPELLPIPQVEKYDSDPGLSSRNMKKRAWALTRQRLRLAEQDLKIERVRAENDERSMKYTTELWKWMQARKAQQRERERTEVKERAADEPSTSRTRPTTRHDRDYECRRGDDDV